MMMFEEEDWKELRYFLRSRMVDMAEKNVNASAVTCTFVELWYLFPRLRKRGRLLNAFACSTGGPVPTNKV